MKISHTIMGAALLSQVMVLPMMAGHEGRSVKKQVRQEQTVRAGRLSYADRMRYDYFFLEAVRQQNRGRYAAAFELLGHCLDIDSTAAEAYFMKARYLSQLKQDTLALDYLKRAARLSPANDTYQESVAQAYIGMNNFAAATEVYEHLYSVNRDRSDVLNILLQLYKQQKQYGKMLSTIDRLEQVEGENEQFALARMSTYELQGDSKNAYRTLKNLADTHKNNPSYSVMLGNWLMHNKRPKEAYDIYRATLDADPDNSYAQASLYDYYRTTGDKARAEQMMQQILFSKSTLDESRQQMIRQAIQDNEQAGADSTLMLQLLDSLHAALPRDAGVAEMRVAYLSMKKLPVPRVNAALEDLLALSPDNGGARFQLIQNKWSQQDWREVEKLSESGMLYNPDELAFYYFTGLARYYQKDESHALEALQKGVTMVSEKSDKELVSDLYAIMGEIYHGMGKREATYAAYDSCLQWKPDNLGTLNNYAYYLSVEGGDLKRAEQMSAKTIAAEPKNATYLDTYAWILYKEERYAEAKIYIDQTLQCSDDSTLSVDVLEHAGDIYEKVGDIEGAVKYWQRAIEKGGDRKLFDRKIRKYKK